MPTAATQLQNNYATQLSLSDLNLTLKILPANLTLCFFGYPFQYHSKTIIWDWEITVENILSTVESILSTQLSTVENILSTFEVKP